ncbi:MAG TPA: beta-xylosidase [Ohtaekwangia sp.]|nr:beta-xylosidase [Ohtaekwangia sp.]
MKSFLLNCFWVLLALPAWSQRDTITLTVDAARPNGTMKPIWAWFGYDEPNYTYMKDGKKLLTALSSMSDGPVYVRTHNLLTSGDATAALKWGSTNAYTEDKKGRPIYHWTIIDSIMDTYVARGMKPIVEIGFMPEALSVKPQPYKHSWSTDQQYNTIFTGWAHPPKDYKKWAELVFQWVQHSLERYGPEEVKTWYWEVWNEPNIGYWQGTLEEYCKLYDYAADALKRACPDCTVGGPHSTGPDWDEAQKFLQRFLEHCSSGKNYVTGKTGSPLDYIAFHAKGSPKIVDGHVRMNMAPQLKAIARGFETVNRFPAFKTLPVIIGECDPEGCAACSMKHHPQNAYRNGTMYSSYTASSYARIYELMDKHRINLQGAVTWAFEFEDQRWFDGFRDLATNGVDKPVLNVFRMFGMMKGERITVSSSDPAALTADKIMAQSVTASPDVHAFASCDGNEIAIMVWNYHDDDLPATDALVEIKLKNVPGNRALLHHYRIDATHSNSYEVWKSMGAPQDVSPEQYSVLEQAGHLALLSSPVWIDTIKNEVTLQFKLPRQGVSLLKFDCRTD